MGQPAAALQAHFAEAVAAERARYAPERLVVAFSGGVDSSVLLHLAADFATRAEISLSALHVDHGLHPLSGNWAAACVDSARALGLACKVHAVRTSPPVGASVEAWAREQRYAALISGAGDNALVLLAHHREDQLETVLHRFGNGAGPHGLRGMPKSRTLGRSRLLRPLLEVDRKSIEAYARTHGLAWTDDPSNLDTRYVRNRIRAEIVPPMQAVFPALVPGVERLASIQAAAADTLDHCADRVLDEFAFDGYRLPGGALTALGPHGTHFVLRRAMVRLTGHSPGYRQLDVLSREVIHARPDASPVVQLGHFSVRRYRGDLFFTRAPMPTGPEGGLDWPAKEALVLATGRLELDHGAAQGLHRQWLEQGRMQVRFRQRGERCRPAGSAHRQVLKKLFQSWAVPPWERELTPLLVINGAVAAVAGHCVCEGFQAHDARDAVALRWTPTLGVQALESSADSQVGV